MSKAKAPAPAPPKANALETAIDAAVLGLLKHAGELDSKGAPIVGAKEIDAAVKWFSVKNRGDADGEAGSRLPRIPTED